MSRIILDLTLSNCSLFVERQLTCWWGICGNGLEFRRGVE